jgi:hypothetical protein
VDKIIVTGQQLEIHLAVPVSDNCPLTSKETLFRSESDSGFRLDANPERFVEHVGPLRSDFSRPVR